MITTPTVLILGAGASNPYGFPLGSGLKTKIVEAITYQDHSMIPLMVRIGLDIECIKEFGESLRLSALSSVDAFIEARPEFIEIGKAAITGILIPLENETILFDQHGPEGGWYPYLWNHLFTDRKLLASNLLSIVTFNYDRSLEHFLFRAIQHSYGVDSDQAYQELKKLRIVHLYGSLGEYFKKPSGWRAYNTKLSDSTMRTAVNSLKIQSERHEDTEEFQQAHRWMQEARRIAFIGFGYNETNVSRLRVKRLSKDREILGTAVGLGDNERRIAEFLVADPERAKLAPGEMNALDFLRNMPVFD